jgi:hypothetical protein
MPVFFGMILGVGAFWAVLGVGLASTCVAFVGLICVVATVGVFGAYFAVNMAIWRSSIESSFSMSSSVACVLLPGGPYFSTGFVCGPPVVSIG